MIEIDGAFGGIESTLAEATTPDETLVPLAEDIMGLAMVDPTGLDGIIQQPDC